MATDAQDLVGSVAFLRGGQETPGSRSVGVGGFLYYVSQMLCTAFAGRS